jgi:hypothetical protein
VYTSSSAFQAARHVPIPVPPPAKGPAFSSAELRLMLAALEPPDCDCEPPGEDEDEGDDDAEPCPHGYGRDHKMSLAGWAALLRQVFPFDYAEPPPPRRGALALTAEARVAVYAARRKAGFGLYHPADLWRHDDDARAGVVAGRGRNGAQFERGLADD